MGNYVRDYMQEYQPGNCFTGCLNIRPTLSFEATAAALGEALGVSFQLDQTGKYEEYPAFRALALGLELALLAPPLPEFDIRETREDVFQLLINSHVHIEGAGMAVNLNALIEAQLLACTGLKVESIE